jgi:hypothetical protein
MRILICLLALCSSATWAASASNSIEQLATQVAPLWQAIKPACVMGLDLETQQAVPDRTDWLNAKMVGSHLTAHLKPLSRNKHKAWKDPSWNLREPLERSALNRDERESLREYFFKLQTQKPNPERAKLVQNVQFMSETLNLALKKELWKTCHALGFHSLPQKQLETAIHQRWLKQKDKVKTQLNRELAAFYFYSFRQVQNTELNTMSKSAAKLTPWVKSTVGSIEQYFIKLRRELLAVNLIVVDPSTIPNAPFIIEQRFNQAPTQNRFSPK